MPQVPIPDTYRVVLTLLRGSEQIVNVLHLKSALALNAAEQQDAAFECIGIYGRPTTDPTPDRGIRQWIDASVNIWTATCQYIGTTPYADPIEYTLSSAGLHVGDPLPLQTALCVSLRTGISSPTARGRLFLGGFGEGASSEASDGNPRPTGTVMQDVLDALQDLDDRLQAVKAGCHMAVASYTEQTSRAVTSVRIPDKWSTQKRRAKSVPISATVNGPL